MTGRVAAASVAQMAATPTPPERPSEREKDVMREIEQDTAWAQPDGAPPDDTDREKRNPEESPCPPSAQPSH